MFRKTLSVVLALAMLCTLLPAFALTASAEDFTGIDYIRAQVNGVDDGGVPKNSPIVLPNSFEMNTDPDAVTVNSLPGDGELTYLLVASNVAAKSNFTGTMSQCNLPNPIIAVDTSGGMGIRGTTDVHGTIVVPGTEAQEFQLVTLARSPNKTVKVIIDGTVADDSLGGGYVTKARWFNAGYKFGTEVMEGDAWDVSPSWDWGKTITLEPGVHTIDIEMMNGNAAGLYGLILTTAKGYDWTKIHRMRNTSAYNMSAEKAAIENSFGEAGLIDFAAPVAVENVAADSAVSYSELTWDAPDETEGYTDVYAYYVTVTGDNFEETYTTIEEELTVDGLQAETTYSYSIKAMDMVGNIGAATTGTFTTGSAADSDEAYFPSSYELSVSDVTTSSFQVEWGVALLGAYASEGEITYAVYVNDELYSEQTETACTISDLVAETAYSIKVVPVLDGVPGVLTYLSDSISTANLSYVPVSAGPLVAYETVNNGAGWTGNVTDQSLGGGNMSDRYWLSPAEAWAISDTEPCYFVGNDGSPAQTATVNIPETGNYYVVARTAIWNYAARYLEVKIDGVAAEANSAEGTHFGTISGGGWNNEPTWVGNTMLNDYSEAPIALTAGDHTITLATKGGWVRVDYVGFVKEADYDGNGEAENADIYWLLNNTLTSKANIMDFFGFKLIDEDDVTMELTDANEVEIAWTPTAQAKGNKNITFEVSINGNVTKVYDFQGRSHTYSMSTDPEFGGLSIGDNVVKFVMKNGDNVVLEKTETFAISAEDMTTAYFSGAALNTTFNATTGVDVLKDTLDLTWDAAVVNEGEFEGSYNVCVNGELVDNTTETAYTLEDLEADTEYEVKIVIVEDGVVLDSYVTSLTKTFKTAKAPAIALVGEAGETEVTIKITDMFEAENYEIALYGSAAKWTLNDDGTVTITDLLPGTKYDITVKSVLDFPYADAYNYVHDKFSFTTAGDAAGEATYTSGMPIINANLATAQGKLGDNTSSPTNNGKWNYLSSDGYKGIYGGSGVHTLYINAGNTLTLTFESPNEAQYYLGAQLYCYSAGRSVKVAINGVQVADFASSSLNNREISDLVTVREGTNEITLTGVGSIVRLDHIAFIPGKSKADALEKYTAASSSVANLEAAFGVPTTLVSEPNILLTQLGTDSIMATWTPNLAAQDKNLTFELSLNGGEAVVLGNNARRHVFALEDGIVLGENTIKFTITDETGLEEVYTKTISISTLLEVAVSDVKVQEEVDGVLQDTDLTDVVTITVNNPTGEVKNIKIMAVVYNGNRVIEKHIKDAELLLNETVEFDLVNNAKAIKPTVKLTPALTQVKYFVLDMDNNAYLPLEINY